MAFGPPPGLTPGTPGRVAAHSSVLFPAWTHASARNATVFQQPCDIHLDKVEVRSTGPAMRQLRKVRGWGTGLDDGSPLPHGYIHIWRGDTAIQQGCGVNSNTPVLFPEYSSLRDIKED